MTSCIHARPDSLALLLLIRSFFFFNDTATTEIYTLSLHDALPIYGAIDNIEETRQIDRVTQVTAPIAGTITTRKLRSEEHTSELQSRLHLVCRLLLEKKKKKQKIATTRNILPELADVDTTDTMAYR